MLEPTIKERVEQSQVITGSTFLPCNLQTQQKILTAKQAIVPPFGLVLLFGDVPAIEEALQSYTSQVQFEREPIQVNSGRCVFAASPGTHNLLMHSKVLPWGCLSSVTALATCQVISKTSATNVARRAEAEGWHGPLRDGCGLEKVGGGGAANLHSFSLWTRCATRCSEKTPPLYNASVLN